MRVSSSSTPVITTQGTRGGLLLLLDSGCPVLPANLLGVQIGCKVPIYSLARGCSRSRIAVLPQFSFLADKTRFALISRVTLLQAHRFSASVVSQLSLTSTTPWNTSPDPTFVLMPPRPKDASCSRGFFVIARVRNVEPLFRRMVKPIRIHFGNLFIYCRAVSVNASEI